MKPEFVPRGFWLISGVALLGAQLAHVWLRPRTWIVDTSWAQVQYNFSLLIYGTLVAALAAWIGRSVRISSWWLRSSPTRLVLGVLAPLFALASSVYLVGLISVVGVSYVAGAPAALTWGSLVDAGIGTLVIAAYMTSGAAIGAHWPRAAAPGLAGLLAFALTMCGWLFGFESLVRLGGASGGVSLIEFSETVRWERIIFWGALAVASAAAIVRLFRSDIAIRWVSRGAALTVVVALLVASTTHDVFVTRESTWSCIDSQVSVCVPTRYERLLPGLQRAIDDSAVVLAIAEANPSSPPLAIEDPNILYEVSRPSSPERDAFLAEHLAIESQTLHAPYCLSQEAAAEMTDEQLTMADQVMTWALREASTPAGPFDEANHIDGLPDSRIGSQEASEFLARAFEVLPPCG